MATITFELNTLGTKEFQATMDSYPNSYNTYKAVLMAGIEAGGLSVSDSEEELLEMHLNLIVSSEKDSTYLDFGIHKVFIYAS